jgi:hypothetical protein
MARYSANNRMSGTQQALSTSYKTLVNIVGATTFRVRLWELTMGADGAPNATDCQIVWDIANKDATTAGTASANITPQKTNPADRAATLTVSGNFTAEPTTFTPYLTMALNQRASQRWVAFDQDSAIVMAATASIGLGVRALSPTYASNGLADVIYEEV